MDTTNTMAAPALPGDVLEDILGRLPARSLAESRRVCKAWRDLVDDGRLLLRLRHLLPHKVSGLFVNYFGHYRPHFLARPPAAYGAPRIDGNFSFIAREKPFDWHCILDHCNGLVLHSGDAFGDHRMYVCNPTTRRCARLPPAPNHYWDPIHRTFLVFDPAVSPAQWEVLMAPPEPHKKTVKAGMKLEKRTMEWPPATWRWSAISSTTMEWEEKVFVREGEAAGTVADLLKHSLEEDYLDEPAQWRYGAYCQGALYVHCRGEYISRLSSSTNKYRVIKSPIDLAEREEGRTSTSIGRSGNSVCFAAFDNIADELRVWTLNESGDETKWLLKHRTVVITKEYEQRKFDGPWTIDAAKDYYDRETGDDKEVSSQLQEDWNSDDDDIMDDEDDRHRTYADFLGFHPYKEVIFFRVRGNSAVAYHLNSTKVQYLAELNPGCYNSGLLDSFVYTPCLLGV